MENPCIRCLVRAACTLICQEKESYQDLIIRDLTEFSNAYLYTDNGYYIGSKHLTSKQKYYHKELLKRCDVNSKEYQKIFSKGRRIT